MEQLPLGYLVIAIIAFAVLCILLYYIIHQGVKTGSQRLIYFLKMQNRMLMKMLKKEGFTAEDIKELHDDPYEDSYWNKLKD